METCPTLVVRRNLKWYIRGNFPYLLFSLVGDTSGDPKGAKHPDSHTCVHGMGVGCNVAL
jgi:hypothetical protein